MPAENRSGRTVTYNDGGIIDPKNPLIDDLYKTLTLQSAAGDPTPADIPDGAVRVWKNTDTGEVRLWVNDGGTLRSTLTATPTIGGAHHATHQNGGDDEINVDGLSGTLADPQTPLAHTHAEAEVTGLVADLTTLAAAVAGKAAASHTHAEADITSLVSDLAGKAAASHTHTRAIGFVIDGGGVAIATGIKGDLSIPFACTILGARLLADQSGSIVVDIWKDTYANYPPTGADSITASAKPTISSATKSDDTTLTGWTTAINAGDTLRFNVDSCTTITRATLILTVTG